MNIKVKNQAMEMFNQTLKLLSALNILIQAKNLWKKHCEEENILMTRLPPG